MTITSPRSGFQDQNPSVPLEFADQVEWLRIIAQFLNRLSPATFRLFDHKGEFGVLINATYDDTTDTFSRLNTDKIAYWFDFRHLVSIPGEEEIAGTKGIIVWRARADAAQPLSGFANVNGWEARLIITEFGELVVPGSGIEVDGNGFTPFGRFTHYTDSVTSPTAELTGILKNLFLDFSGVDVSGDPSWFVGFDGLNDRFIVRRWVAGATGTGTGTDLFRVDNSGAVQVVGPLGLVSYTVAGLPAAGSFAQSLVYVSNETGGPTIAFSDGTNWRRVQDRAVVS